MRHFLFRLPKTADLVLGRKDGTCLGGHAAAGCTIFACEATILEPDGPALVREPDAATGLTLWPLA